MHSHEEKSRSDAPGGPRRATRAAPSGLQASIGNQAVARMMRAAREAEEDEHQQEHVGECEQTVQRPDTGVAAHMTAFPGGLLGLQATVGNQAVARTVRAAREAERGRHQPAGGPGQAVQRTHTGEGPRVPERSDVEAGLLAPGRPLDPGVRARKEEQFQADLSSVRVHTGAAAEQAAAAVQARAFTVGQDIMIGRQGSDSRTLDHELTHMIRNQHKSSVGHQTGGGFHMTHPHDHEEREAESNAARMSSGGASTVRGPGLAGNVPVQRSEHTPGEPPPARSPGAPAARASRNGGHLPLVQRASPGSDSDIELDDLPVHIPQAAPPQQDTVMHDAPATQAPGETTPRSRQGSHVRRTGRMPPGYSERQKQISQREAEVRFLDRIARILIAGVEGAPRPDGQKPTPHIAVVLRNGVLHASPNTDVPFTGPQRVRADALLRHAVRNSVPPTDSVPEDRQERHLRDTHKIAALVDGSYDDEGRMTPWMEAARAAVQRGVTWDVQMGNRAERPRGGGLHAEMRMLQSIIADRARNGPVPEGEEEKVRLGGSKMPCLLCHWVIDAVNVVIGQAHGFTVVATQTHSRPYPWFLPPWLFDGTAHMEKVRRMVMARVQGDRRLEAKGRKIEVKGTPASTSEDPPWSDSEYEPE
ncbi:DUF4157 domain-containing protein [Streptomyces sp. LP05-1]|uniref:DUF4157 domain-containing protein n=1 Tax=Streptomyces pyxinae TaxID=2970734 RepID=A0ABT2CCE1_9ACTN|nr:DUF4157 domain-containing protein [Streptomyces sp. LP05-1]MCS0634980.1 DUF4157 domain-containing protein [Streptomyces sp. LP05-1]